MKKADFPKPRPYQYQDLLDIMAGLRSPQGCPWDKEQTFETLLPFLKEESAEYIDAVLKNDTENMAEELGDVLLQVVFHSQIAAEKKAFSMNEVIDGICHKLVTRHPHVFGEELITEASGVEVRWEEIKKKEKGPTKQEGETGVNGMTK